MRRKMKGAVRAVIMTQRLNSALGGGKSTNSDSSTEGSFGAGKSGSTENRADAKTGASTTVIKSDQKQLDSSKSS